MLILIKRSIAFNIVWRESIPEALEIVCYDLKLLQPTLRRVIVVYGTSSCNFNDSVQLWKFPVICVHSKDTLLSLVMLTLLIFTGQKIRHVVYLLSHSTSLNSALQPNPFKKYVRTLVQTHTRFNSLYSSQSIIVKGVNVSAHLSSSKPCCLPYEIIIPVDRLLFRYSRTYCKANYEVICHFVLPFGWRNILEWLPNTNDKYENFSSILHIWVQEFVPPEERLLSHGNVPPYLFQLAEPEEKASHHSQTHFMLHISLHQTHDKMAIMHWLKGRYLKATLLWFAQYRR